VASLAGLVELEEECIKFVLEDLRKDLVPEMLYVAGIVPVRLLLSYR
jgi:hypothetical protein